MMVEWKDIPTKIKTGDKVRYWCRGNDLGERTVGEITGDTVMLNFNRHSIGDYPNEKLELLEREEVIYKTNCNGMNVIEFFRNLGASVEDKLLKEYKIEDPIGTPTQAGLDLSAQITYKANREAIVGLVKKMDEAAKKKE